MAQFDQITASRAVLIEVANVLGAFREQLVLVGGWVPELLLPNRGHIGSVDVDLAVAPTALGKNAYQTIVRRMINAGYVHQNDPTRFVKAVAGAPEPVKVDLISGQYGEGEKAASVQVDELQINTLRGIDLAFEAWEEKEISGTMPDGKTQNVVRVRIVRPEAFMLIKAFALEERTKAKDAYDIAFVLEYYEPDLAALAERVRPHVGQGLGREAYAILKGKFATLESVGPVWAATVLEEQGFVFDDDSASGSSGFEYEQAQQAAFQNAQELFRLVERQPAS